MTYEEFKQELMDRLTQRTADSARIGECKLYEDGMTSDIPEEKNFIKSTNIKYSKVESDSLIGDFLNIQVKDEQVSHSRFEVKYLYDSFAEGGWDAVWEIIDENLRYAASINLKNLSENLANYEAIKDMLILRPLNFTDNRYELKECVYRRVGDIALVLYILVSSGEMGLNTIKVQKSFLLPWDKDVDEIMEAALINTNVRFVPRMYDLGTISSHPNYEEGAYMALGATCKLGRMGSGTFTTYPHLNGSISFWYPGVQEKIAEMAGGDYYVAFTGIHDFHVHPVGSIRARDVLANLKHMNKVNAEGETLSRKVYLYKADTKDLIELVL